MDSSPTGKDGSDGWLPEPIGFPPEEEGPQGDSCDPREVPTAPGESRPREIDFGLGPVEANPRRGMGSCGRPAWERLRLIEDLRQALTPAVGGAAPGRVSDEDWDAVEALSALTAAARAACGPADAADGRDRASSTAA